jgi:hypothetical protein
VDIRDKPDWEEIPFEFKLMNTWDVGMEMNEKETGEKFRLVRLTVGGASTIIQSKSQITLLQKMKTSMDVKDQDQQEPVSHLFPENLGQLAMPVTAQAKQADKH